MSLLSALKDEIGFLLKQADRFEAEARRCRTVAERLMAGKSLENVPFFNIALEMIAERHGISQELILSKSRVTRVSFARQLLCHVAYHRTKMSYPDIGELIGKDHSTVIHADKLMSKRRKESPEFARTVEKLIADIHAEMAQRARLVEAKTTTEVAA